jgi:oxygen-independent coproporphyrinogen-3 oxidase
VPSEDSARHLYVHVPFCTRKCSYCDFAIAVRRVVPVKEYVDSLRNEFVVRNLRETLAPLASLYFGGGTPSRLGAPGVAEAIAVVREFAELDADAEVTLEANPEDITPDAVESWKQAGVNRLSIGIQTFDDAVLSWMHRVHDAERAAHAVAIARAGGIDAYSVDLIFALPEFLTRNWERDLDRTLALDADHVSLYGLTIEPDTPLGRWKERGDVLDTPDEKYESDFLLAHERLTSAGYQHYEVSNFAKPGKRARHNSAYWRHVPYVGVGPSAHGFDGRRRRWNARHYSEWASVLASQSDPIAGEELLVEANRQAETVYLGLRTSDGLVLLNDEERLRVLSWDRQGWVEVLERTESGAPSRVRCTALGWMRLDALAADLTAVRSHS